MARGRMPRFMHMRGHNHASIVAHFDSGEDSLGRELLDFVRPAPSVLGTHATAKSVQRHRRIANDSVRCAVLLGLRPFVVGLGLRLHVGTKLT